jgi:hypothetical protein
VSEIIGPDPAKRHWNGEAHVCALADALDSANANMQRAVGIASFIAFSCAASRFGIVACQANRKIPVRPSYFATTC